MDIAGHRLESLRGDPKLQESVEKKTFTGESTFTPTAPGLIIINIYIFKLINRKY